MFWISIDNLSNLCNFFICKILNTCIWINASLFKNLRCSYSANTVNISKSYFNTLFSW